MNIKDFIIRYSLLVCIGLGNLFILYKVFTPLTVYPVSWILSSAYDAHLVSFSPTPVIFFKGYYARIIPACVGGAAYYLLIILNLSTPMALIKRVTSLFSMISLFLIANISRIVIFALMVPKGYAYFDAAHELSWYFGSTILVLIIWFITVYSYKIKEIPFYSDIKTLYREATNPHPR